MSVVSKVKKNVGPSGVADVRLLKSGVRVTFADGASYDVEGNPTELWPRPAGKFFVTLSATGDKIYGARPVPGTYLARFKRFAPGKNDTKLPEPWTMKGGPVELPDGRKWYQEDRLMFTALLEVLSGGEKYEGLEIPYMLQYVFQELPGTAFTQMSAGRKALEKVEAFFKAVGFDTLTQDIPFSVNVLPWLENAILGGPNTVFFVTLNDKCYVDNMHKAPPEALEGLKKGKK